MPTELLDALAATFLEAEHPLTPMHIGSLSVFDGRQWLDRDGRLRLDELRQHLAAKVTPVTRLQQYPTRPVVTLGRYLWVDDPDFDIARHVRTVALPSPGTETALRAVAAELHMQLLDRSHPLWELWFVTGLPDGRVGLVQKIHHALVDGIGGVDVAMTMLDAAPDTPAPEPPYGDEHPPARYSQVRLAAETIVGTVSAFTGAATGLAHLARRPVQTVKSAAELLDATVTVLPRLRAPQSSLNTPIGYSRSYRTIRRSLGATRRTAHSLGVTINDTVLAVTTSGLRELLLARQEDPAGLRLNALVPVSVRSDAEQHALGNRVAAMLVDLPVDLDDPARRLAHVRRAVREGRAHHEPDLSRFVVAALDRLPGYAIGPLANLVHRQPMINVVVTNVPGAPFPLYLMGGRMLATYPIVPLGRNLTLSVGILSYDDDLTMGLWADGAAVPDIDHLAKSIEAEFDMLDHLAAKGGNHDEPPHPPPRAGRRRGTGVEG